MDRLGNRGIYFLLLCKDLQDLQVFSDNNIKDRENPVQKVESVKWVNGTEDYGRIAFENSPSYRDLE